MKRGPGGMRRWSSVAVFVRACLPSAVVALAACSSVEPSSVPPSQSTEVPAPAFAPTDQAMPARFALEGRLRLRGTLQGAVRSQDGAYITQAEVDAAAALVVDLGIDLVSDGPRVLPERSGALEIAQSPWEVRVGAGLAREEPGAPGIVQAWLPVALMEKNANCLHHGMLYVAHEPGRGRTRAWLRIARETCRYLHVDFDGPLSAEFSASPSPLHDRVLADRDAQVAARLPVRPLAQIAHDYPGLDPARLDIGPPTGQVVHGLSVGGIHYRSDCSTRQGKLPLCDELDIPSFSLAKSMFAATALMRLEKVAPGIARRPIASLVPSCAEAGWGEVTLLDALDMATGRFDSDAFEVDEDAPKSDGLFRALTAAGKTVFACTAYPRRVDPGTRWVYHTSDTYLLGTALAAALREARPGRRTDIFDDLFVAAIADPLQLSPAAHATRRTSDAQAQPFTGWGLVLHPDDIVRIGRFLQQQADADEPTLERHLLREALQLVPEARGLPTADLAGFRYQHGFWARDVGALAHCGVPLWVPFMSGFGGISVVLFPNGVIYYNVADDGSVTSFDWGPVVTEVARLAPLCPPVVAK